MKYCYVTRYGICKCSLHIRRQPVSVKRQTPNGGTNLREGRDKRRRGEVSSQTNNLLPTPVSQNATWFSIQGDFFSNHVRSHNSEFSDQLLDQSQGEDLLFEDTFGSQSSLTRLNSPELLSAKEAFPGLDTQDMADDLFNNMVDLEIDNMSPVTSTIAREYEQPSMQQRTTHHFPSCTQPQASPLMIDKASPRASIVLSSPQRRRPEQFAVLKSSALLPVTEHIGNDIMSRLQEDSGTFFFHLTDMLQKKQPESRQEVYDLFGRVIYTQRENFHHRQYFRLRDAFRDTPPLLNGVLSG
jgi:hypothetical protein